MSEKNQTQASGHSVALAVVALFAGILIGIVGAGVYDADDLTQVDRDKKEASEAEATFHAEVTSALREHALLAGMSARGLYDGHGDEEIYREFLEENGSELSGAIVRFYGEDAGADVDQAWHDYTDGLIDYTVAAREGDPEELTEAEAELTEHIEIVMDVLSQEAGLDEAAAHEWAEDYTRQLLSLIDSHAAGNFDESYVYQQDMNDHMIKLADLLLATADAPEDEPNEDE